MNNLEIDRVLQTMLSFKQNISDLHFYVGRPPQTEVSGILMPVPIKGFEKLSPFQLDVIAMSILGQDREALRRLIRLGSTDFSYSIPGVTRFRVSIYKQRGTLAVVMRVIPYGVPSIKEMQLPDVLYEVANERTGIVLVTGPTGSGKSTTIAAIIDEINETNAFHIVTIEDPIEYLYRHKKSSICQRELGADTTSFATALRAALRQSPKVIVVGEMRDMETAEIALEAAETGHLVFSTLHTIDASKAIDRIIGIFPQSEEVSIRNRFAQSFRYVIAQRLIPKKDGGRVASVEVLKSTPRTREYIVKGEAENRSLLDAMNDGFLEGMQTFDKDLERLVRAGLVEKDVALRYSSNANNLALALQTIAPDEQMGSVWSEIVDKEELTPSDILRLPDAIQQMVEEVDEQEIDRVIKKVLNTLIKGDDRQKISVLSVLQPLVTMLTTYDRWKNLESAVFAFVSRCYQKEMEEEVLFAYLGYLQTEFHTKLRSKKYSPAMELLNTIHVHLEKNERMRRHFSMALESSGDFFKEEICSGMEGADVGIEFCKMAGEKGSEFLLNWLAAEEDRSVRVRLLGYFERLNMQHLEPQVEKKITHYKWYVVRNMITILTKVKLPKTSEFLRIAVQNEDARVLKEILRRLYQSCSATDSETLHVLLRHPDKSIRIQAIHLIPIVNLEAEIPLLLSYAGSVSAADTDLRAACFQSLLKMRSMQAVPLAKRALERKAGSKIEIAERNAAVKLLGDLASQAALSILQKLASGDPHPETRDAARAYVG
jgi:twitching motility protein PilT